MFYTWNLYYLTPSYGEWLNLRVGMSIRVICPSATSNDVIPSIVFPLTVDWFPLCFLTQINLKWKTSLYWIALLPFPKLPFYRCFRFRSDIKQKSKEGENVAAQHNAIEWTLTLMPCKGKNKMRKQEMETPEG